MTKCLNTSLTVFLFSPPVNINPIPISSLHGLVCCTAGDRVRLNAFLRRCVKLGYRDQSAPCIEDIFGDCDDQLFAKINTNSLHILQQYLPERSSINYSLRPRRQHNKTLITKTSEFDRDFIIRNIYKDLY